MTSCRTLAGEVVQAETSQNCSYPKPFLPVTVVVLPSILIDVMLLSEASCSIDITGDGLSGVSPLREIIAPAGTDADNCGWRG